MKETVILLGGNKLHRGFDDWKTRNNIDKIYVLDWNDNPAYVGNRHIQVDIKNVDKVLQIIKEQDLGDILFCYTSADIAVLTQVQVHKLLGFQHPPLEAVNRAACKNKSTACWKKDQILNRYSEVYKYCEIDKIPKSIDNIIIKPNMSSGSRAITIINNYKKNIDVVERAFEKAKRQSYDSMVVIEEFVVGTEYTVEMLGDCQGNVSVLGISKKYYTKYVTDNRIATKLHYNPSDVSFEQLQQIGEFGQKCYRSIGLKSSLGHLELIVTDEGIMSPIEIGARSSGYIATHCLDAINNMSILMQYSEVLRGNKVENGLVFNRNKSSMYYFYDIMPGTAQRTSNIMKFAPGEIHSLQNDRSKLHKDSVFQAVDEDAERFGYEILVAERNALSIDTVNQMEQNFLKEFIGKNE